MSAFVVSTGHLNAVIDYARRTRRYGGALGDGLPSLDEPQALGELLYAENVRSVDYRYAHRDPDEMHVPVFMWQRGASHGLTGVAVLKLLDCLEYQSCECDDYHTTPAWWALQALRRHVIRTLPGYDAASWTI